MHERHAVFATTTDHRRVRLTQYTSYDEALEVWNRLANARADMNRWFTRVPGTAPRSAEIKHIEVRSEDDPRYNTAPCAYYGVEILTKRGYVSTEALGRAIVRREGIESLGGGWFRTRRGKVQGLSEVVAVYGGEYRLEDGKVYGRLRHIATW